MGAPSSSLQREDVWLGMAQIGLVCLLLFEILSEQKTNEHVQFLRKKTLASIASQGV